MATAVPGTFTRAALGESLGRTKPGVQRDSRRYRSRATVPGATGFLGASGVPSALRFLNFGYWLLAIFRATGLGQ
jgi:hypothetical protein